MTDGGSGGAAIEQAVTTASASAPTHQPASLDPTPWDEGVAGAVAEAPAIEQSGGGGALIVAAAAPVGSGAGVPVAPGASPTIAGSQAAAPAAVARGTDISEAGFIGEVGPDRSLLTAVDANIVPMATTIGRSTTARTFANTADGVAPAIDGDGDAEGITEPSWPVAEPAPPPRSPTC